MMAAASCSVGIIPFHRPRLPYLDPSSYSPAPDPVGSPCLSHVNVSSLASASSRYPALARKRIAAIEILSGKFHPEILLYITTRRQFFHLSVLLIGLLLDTPLIYIPYGTLNSAWNICCAGKVKSRREETCNICILRRAKSRTGYKAARKN